MRLKTATAAHASAAPTALNLPMGPAVSPWRRALQMAPGRASRQGSEAAGSPQPPGARVDLLGSAKLLHRKLRRTRAQRHQHDHRACAQQHPV